MRIIGSRWTKLVNVLTVRCHECGTRFPHRADDWRVVCPVCGETAWLDALRLEYAMKEEREDGS